MSQHIARFTHGHVVDRYSYGRRLLGLSFRASPKLTHPLNLPAPGRRHRVYVVLRLSTLLCFWETVAWVWYLRPPQAPHAMAFSLPGRSYSRSYGAILRNSLTRVNSLAKAFSTCPPVSARG